jgi:NAD-dependent deacetylase
MRPDVVWFGESLDPIILEQAFSEAGKADLCLVVGTSAVVHPAASVPLATLQNGGALVEVNPEETPLTIRAAVHLALPSAEVLPLLLET